MNRPNIVRDKSYVFAIEVVRLCQKLQQTREFILSKQILRSGTSICANIQESVFGQSKADFINKLSIALKEAYETDYWLQLLRDTQYVEQQEAERLRSMLSEILALLIASLKTAKGIVKIG